jgi:hypothetical protein
MREKQSLALLFKETKIDLIALLTDLSPRLFLTWFWRLKTPIRIYPSIGFCNKPPMGAESVVVVPV